MTRSALEMCEEERRQIYEDRWASGGLSFYYTFTDLLTDPAANRTLEELFKEKIRSRVSDPEIAALLPRHRARRRLVRRETLTVVLEIKEMP